MERSLGSIIKELRLGQGWSQEDLAEKLNRSFGVSINKGMISKWENNLVDPRLEIVRHIARLFNVSLDFLLGLDGENKLETIAAHHDGEDFTEEELQEIEAFKAFVKSKRNRGE